MQPFDYYKPQTLVEAFQVLNTPGKTVVPLAGGTDFIPLFRDGLWKVDAVVDIKGIDDVQDIHEVTNGLFVGAAVRMADIAHSKIVKSHWDVLAQGASVVGSDQIRNRATLGGNLVTASPCADTPPALMVLNAQVVIKNQSGERRVPMTDFFISVRKTVVQKGELVMGVIIPKPAKGSAAVYEKLSRRKGFDLSLVSVAVLAEPSKGGYSWRIALGAVAPTVIRATEAEEILAKGTSAKEIQDAAKAAADQAKPISDVRSSEGYRRAMLRNITIRAVEKVLAKLS